MNVINNIKKALCSDFIELDFLPSGGKETGACPADRQSTHGHKYVGRPAVTGQRSVRHESDRQSGQSFLRRMTEILTSAPFI